MLPKSPTDADRSHEPSAAATLLGTGIEASCERAEGPEPAPTSVGRYEVTRRLGAGAMGAVYEARDPDLDRPVALKLLRGDLSERARQRMQREALALARLSHPNVVQIYEIGRTGGQTFIAMELVRGRTLDDWQRSVPRPGVREALRLYAQAGEGLAAAHAEGLVHRDFKPSNCMLGEDGRVRVVDFGLATEAADETEATLPSCADDDAPLPLTRTGAVMGTPAYMPPEQLGRGPVDPRADQFSFCVSFYEALYGQRPFDGESLGELLHAVEEGRVRPAPREADVPGFVRKVVLRGLCCRPEQRWPSMRALLDALAEDPARRRRRWAWAGGLVLAASMAFGVAFSGWPGAGTCRGAAAKLEGAWDDERRAAVEQALLGTGLGFAPDTWERVQAGLDDYAGAFARAHEEACEATRAGEQSEALMDLRIACLDERHQHLRAAVDELSRADEAVVERAVQVVLGLPRLERCADADALMADVRPPEDPAVAERVAELRAVLVEAEAKRRAGKDPEGLPLAERVVAEAEELGYEPLRAEAWLQLAWLRDGVGDYEGAKEAFERAYDAAVAERMVEVAADASAQLVWVLGERLSRAPEAWRWAKSADPLSRAVGSDVARVRYLNHVGVLAHDTGELTRAGEHLERALALQERATGPQHRVVGDILDNLGVLAQTRGDLAMARAYEERALAIAEQTLGPRHPAVAGTLTNLGVTARRMDDPAKARDYYSRALAILESTYGPEHPDVGRVVANMGSVAHSLGEAAEAREYYMRAFMILERSLGPEHPTTGTLIANLGDLAHMEGDYATALAHQQHALAIFEKALGPEHPALAEQLSDLALVQLDAGQPAEAIVTLERAVALAVGPDVPPTLVGELRFMLTMALEARGHHERARAEAGLARTAYAQAGEASAADLAQVEAWIAGHGEQ